MRLLSCLAALFLAWPALAQPGRSPTLDLIRARGQLVCGVTTGTAGFSLADSRGVMQGLHADTCRAIAAAILGRPDVRFVPTTTQNRFTMLQSGEIDVLVRNATWTLGREANLGLMFAGVSFYDGTGFMVKATAGIASARQLDGAAICVQPGSSTELAVADYFRLHGMRFTPVLIADLAEIQNTYLAGRCDAYSTDLSTLASYRYAQGPRAGEHTLLPEVISKEPLGLMVRKGDDTFFDAVRWTLFALLQAEESGVTQANLAEMQRSSDPEVRRLLGVEGALGPALGLGSTWAADAIRAVGNFAELWDRTIGVLGIERGLNRLWSRGGLHYPPPMR